jgi:hypothetical protein
MHFSTKTGIRQIAACKIGIVSSGVCFGASQLRIRLYEIWIPIRILLSSSKNSTKNLDSYCFVTS